MQSLLLSRAELYNKTIVAVNQSLQCYCVESFSIHIIFRTLERWNDRHMATVKSGHYLGKPRMILYFLLILQKENIQRKKNTCKYLAYLYHDGTHGGFSNSSVASGVGKPIQSNCNMMANCNGLQKFVFRFAIWCDSSAHRYSNKSFDILKSYTESLSLQPWQVSSQKDRDLLLPQTKHKLGVIALK